MKPSPVSVASLARSDPASPTAFALETFFPGKVVAAGYFMSRFRDVKRGVSVMIEGRWEGKTLVVSQDIAFHDGARDKEIWRYKSLGDRLYEGTREGITDTSVVYPHENGLLRDYVGTMRSGAFRGLKVRYRYFMTLEADGTLRYRGVITKWGIRLGAVAIRARRDEFATIQPQAPAVAA